MIKTMGAVLKQIETTHSRASAQQMVSNRAHDLWATRNDSKIDGDHPMNVIYQFAWCAKAFSCTWKVTWCRSIGTVNSSTHFKHWGQPLSVCTESGKLLIAKATFVQYCACLSVPIFRRIWPLIQQSRPTPTHYRLDYIPLKRLFLL